MKTIILLVLSLTYMSAAISDCQDPVDTLVIGDSQTGSKWSKSYFGDFLQTCLKEEFIIFGKGASIISNWLEKGGLENIEIIQRDPKNPQLSIGIGDQVPLCKKRIGPMLDAYQPRKVLFFFGDNYIGNSDEEIVKEAQSLVKLLDDKNIPSGNCFFLTPTYEMQIQTKRNVPRKNLANTKRIREALKKGLSDRCQFLDGLELMKTSSYFDGKELLKRVQIEGKPGCSGAAANDNIHVCGEAAKDLALKTCEILNEL